MGLAIELVGTALDDERGKLVYQVHDETDAAVARAVANAYAPAVWNGLLKRDVQVEELGGDMWSVEVPYGKLERPEQGSINWSFNISGEQIQITHAKKHVATFPAGAANHGGAIGVRQDGNGQTVEGCKVYVPVFSWEETHYYAYNIVATHTFLTKLKSLVATVNQDPWRIWGKGESLLLGASGSKQGEKDVGITYKFAQATTVTGKKLGDVPTGIEYDKEGHHYLWIEYEQDDDSDNLIAVPKAVHVERVYDYGDWANDLPIPDPWS